jgi:excisionase family DNA binding protein
LFHNEQIKLKNMEKIAYLIDENDIKKIVENVVNELKKSEQPVEVEDKPEKLYTAEEACKILRCSKPTLHRWKKLGIIPFVRIGVNIRYKESDIKNLLNQKRR